LLECTGGRHQCREEEVKPVTSSKLLECSKLRAAEESYVNGFRQMHGRSLTVSLKEPWNFLAETVATLQTVTDAHAQLAGWCRLLQQVRTFFEANPGT